MLWVQQSTEGGVGRGIVGGGRDGLYVMTALCAGGYGRHVHVTSISNVCSAQQLWKWPIQNAMRVYSCTSEL